VCALCCRLGLRACASVQTPHHVHTVTPAAAAQASGSSHVTHSRPPLTARDTPRLRSVPRGGSCSVCSVRVVPLGPPGSRLWL
jgi:hypothetical protein